MRRYIAVVGVGMLASGLVVASCQDSQPKIAAKKETTRIIKTETGYPRNIRLGEALKNPYIMDSVDTTINNEWEFSFDGWEYVPCREFAIRPSESQESESDSYVRDAIQKHRFMETYEGDEEYVRQILSEFEGVDASMALAEIKNYVNNRMKRNNSFSTKPQSVRATLEGSGNCLDYSAVLAKVVNCFVRQANPHMHAFPAAIYRHGDGGEVGHAVVFLFNTETKRFTIEDIYSKTPIEEREVKMK